MKKDKTGVQLDLGHTSTDDFITKKYVLPNFHRWGLDCLWTRCRNTMTP